MTCPAFTVNIPPGPHTKDTFPGHILLEIINSTDCACHYLVAFAGVVPSTALPSKVLSNRNNPAASRMRLNSIQNA